MREIQLPQESDVGRNVRRPTELLSAQWQGELERIETAWNKTVVPFYLARTDKYTMHFWDAEWMTPAGKDRSKQEAIKRMGGRLRTIATNLDVASIVLFEEATCRPAPPRYGFQLPFFSHTWDDECFGEMRKLIHWAQRAYCADVLAAHLPKACEHLVSDVTRAVQAVAEFSKPVTADYVVVPVLETRVNTLVGCLHGLPTEEQRRAVNAARTLRDIVQNPRLDALPQIMAYQDTHIMGE